MAFLWMRLSCLLWSKLSAKLAAPFGLQSREELEPQTSTGFHISQPPILASKVLWLQASKVLAAHEWLGRTLEFTLVSFSFPSHMVDRECVGEPPSFECLSLSCRTPLLLRPTFRTSRARASSTI